MQKKPISNIYSMEFENKITYKNNKGDTSSEINLIELYENLKNNWKLMVIGLCFALVFAYVYLRYSKDQYQVSSTIFLNDEKTGGVVSELAAFEELGMLSSNSKKSIINEIGVLKSLTLMEKVIKNLGINITYYSKGRFVNYELYADKVPFHVNFVVNDSILLNLNTEFTITAQSRTRYFLKSGDDDEVVENFLFGENIKRNFGEINITAVNTDDIKIGESLIVKITPLKLVAKNYRGRISIEPQEQTSSLLVVTLTDEVKEKAQDIVNNLTTQYINDGIEYKKMISRNTDNFVNDRILDISVDLSSVDKGVEAFKIRNKLTDIEAESSLVLQSNSEIGKKIVDLNSQIQLINYINEYMSENSDQLIPSNLGLDDSSSNSNIIGYNGLLMEKNRILKGSSNLNPSVIILDEQIEKIKQSIVQSLNNLKSALEFSLNEAKKEEYSLNMRRSNAPQQEREFQDIKRKQQIIETLYLYLLQKKEENALSLGIPVPNAKIIDKANGSELPIFPKPKLIYTIAGLLGLITPLIIITIRSSLDNMVHSSEDVEAVVEAPIIGDIPRINFKKKVIITDRDNSSIAEAFRLVRTNVNFMLTNAKEDAKIIFVTSTLASEGKTFITINLALSMSLLDKKVLLIGADIRKPKIRSYLELKSHKGLTNYLIDKNLNISDIILNHGESKYNIDIISSGEIPPNPSELLLNGRFENVLSYSKEHYDYVFIDTAPVNMVTDTLLLGSKADLFIYIIRAEYLDKRLLKVPQTMYKNNRLPNMAMVINAINHKDKSYSYSYGYGANEKSWWKRIF